MRTLCSLIVVALLLALPIAALASDPGVYDLLAGNPKTGVKDAGDLFVGDDGSDLYVKYVLDFGPWQFTEMHLEVTEVGPGQIPQKKGNPIPGKFAYSNGPYFGPIPLSGKHPVTDVDYDWESGDVLYIAAHGKICTDVDSIIAAIDALSTVKMVVVVLPPGDPPVYALQVTISDGGFLNGIYSAYCIVPSLSISGGEKYEVDPDTNGFSNMDRVNYLINHEEDYVGEDSPGGYGVYTTSDIQGAIWKLFEMDLSIVLPIVPFPVWERVDEIVADVMVKGENFEPECGEYLGVKLFPEEGKQPILIKFPLKCCQTVWGAEVDYSVDPPTYAHEFGGNNWALYVTYVVGSAPIPLPDGAAPPRMSLDSSVTTTWGSIKNR